MRHILIDHARKSRMEKIDIELMPGVALTRQRSEWLMAFDESLHRLAAFDRRGAKIVELTYFVGLNRKDLAELFQISVKTVQRDLDSCMRWITREMGVTNE
jgi:DNA-directed RNA polymerase specialized sigma24 family protein